MAGTMAKGGGLRMRTAVLLTGILIALIAVIWTLTTRTVTGTAATSAATVHLGAPRQRTDALGAPPRAPCIRRWAPATAW